MIGLGGFFERREAERDPCRHDSMRLDGLLDDHCLKCGADGYWHDGHQHDKVHPSGKLLFRLDHSGA